MFNFFEWSLWSNRIIWSETICSATKKCCRSACLCCNGLVSTDTALFLLIPRHTCHLFQHCWRVNEKYIFWEAWSCHFPLKNPSRELAWKPELCTRKSLILLCICERTQRGWYSDTAWVNTAFSDHRTAINLPEIKSKGDFIVANKVKYHGNIMGFIHFLNSILSESSALYTSRWMCLCRTFYLIFQMLGVWMCGGNLSLMFSLGTLMNAFDWW